MGTYYKTREFNGRPVYRSLKNRQIILYYYADRYWIVVMMQRNQNTYLLAKYEPNSFCPDEIGRIWRYRRDQWYRDNTIKVTCTTNEGISNCPAFPQPRNTFDYFL